LAAALVFSERKEVNMPLSSVPDWIGSQKNIAEMLVKIEKVD
jgi:hypothetical protein